MNHTTATPDAALIAETILAQLGGGRFRTMTGSSRFAAQNNGLVFTVGRNVMGINYCEIRLNSLDLYDITYGFLRVGKLNVKAESTNVYADRLQADFTAHTGLYTRL